MQGKITFEALGESRELRFTTNAICQLEADTGTDIISYFQSFETEPSFEKVRRGFRCALGRGATDDVAGDIMDEIGIPKAMSMMQEALLAAFPQGNDAADTKAGGKGNGRRPA